MTEGLLTDADVAERLGVGERWVAEEAKAGRIPHIKLGRARRYKPEHVEQILADHEQKPRGEEPPPAPKKRRKPPQAAPSKDVLPLQRKTPRKMRSS